MRSVACPVEGCENTYTSDGVHFREHRALDHERCPCGRSFASSAGFSRHQRYRKHEGHAGIVPGIRRRHIRFRWPVVLEWR